MNTEDALWAGGLGAAAGAVLWEIVRPDLFNSKPVFVGDENERIQLVKDRLVAAGIPFEDISIPTNIRTLASVTVISVKNSDVEKAVNAFYRDLPGSPLPLPLRDESEGPPPPPQ